MLCCFQCYHLYSFFNDNMEWLRYEVTSGKKWLLVWSDFWYEMTLELYWPSELYFHHKFSLFAIFSLLLNLPSCVIWLSLLDFIFETRKLFLWCIDPWRFPVNSYLREKWSLHTSALHTMRHFIPKSLHTKVTSYQSLHTSHFIPMHFMRVTSD